MTTVSSRRRRPADRCHGRIALVAMALATFVAAPTTVSQETDHPLDAGKKEALTSLHKSVQVVKGATSDAREQKQAFARLSILMDLLRFYEKPGSEAPDAVFAQRLPAAVEQLAAALGHGVAVVDVNDLGRVKVLASSRGCDEALLERALRPNPAGNANQRTPLVVVRPQ